MKSDLPPDTTWTSAHARLFPVAANPEHRATMSAGDVAAHVEHALSLVGWNPLDHGQVRRPPPDEGAPLRLELRIDGAVRVVILVFEPSDPPSAHAALLWRDKEDTKWLMMTDGLQWMVFRPGEEGRPPFEMILSDDPPASARLIDDLAFALQFQRHLLDRLVSGRDRNVLKVELVDLLSSSAPFARALSERLEANGVRMSADDVAVSVHAMLATPAELGLVQKAGRVPRDRDVQRGAPTGYVPPSIDEAPWPAGATHRLARKGLASFIRFDPVTRHATLLPGSVMRLKTGSSFPGHHRRFRESALSAGLLRVEGDLLRVVAEITLETPTTAATLVSGVSDNGWKAWRDPEGNPISRGPVVEEEHEPADEGR